MEAIDDAVLGRQPQDPPSSLGVQKRNKESWVILGSEVEYNHDLWSSFERQNL